MKYTGTSLTDIPEPRDKTDGEDGVGFGDGRTRDSRFVWEEESQVVSKIQEGWLPGNVDDKGESPYKWSIRGGK